MKKLALLLILLMTSTLLFGCKGLHDSLSAAADKMGLNYEEEVKEKETGRNENDLQHFSQYDDYDKEDEEDDSDDGSSSYSDNSSSGSTYSGSSGSTYSGSGNSDSSGLLDGDDEFHGKYYSYTMPDGSKEFSDGYGNYYGDSDGDGSIDYSGSDSDDIYNPHDTYDSSGSGYDYGY